jgi:hypothetical protein
LKLRRDQGSRLVELHHERYADYWEWSDYKLQRAFEAGELVARDGWRCGIDTRSPVFTVRNWLIQTNASAIFRYAGLLMRSLDLAVVALVHDAMLLETELASMERTKALAVECLERASRRFLHGLTLRVDAKPILPGERFADPRGKRTWSFVERNLLELEGIRRRAAE